jgi:hypothetical protein
MKVLAGADSKEYKLGFVNGVLSQKKHKATWARIIGISHANFYHWGLTQKKIEAGHLVWFFVSRGKHEYAKRLLKALDIYDEYQSLAE